MGYYTTTTFPLGTSKQTIVELLQLLDYKYLNSYTSKEKIKISHYQWFEKHNYKSWDGISLDLFIQNKQVIIETGTTINLSYYDLEQLNKTLKTFRKLLKAEFVTSYGKNRYLNIELNKLGFAESGCAIAYNYFGNNFGRVRHYFESREYEKEPTQLTGHYLLDFFNPKTLSNSLILTYLVSILEDYWKSTYIALLKYSTKKKSILKQQRITADRLYLVSNNELSIEEAFAESLNFSRISIVQDLFKKLDTNLKFFDALRKPISKSKKSIYDSLEEMVNIRNEIIHKASTPIILDNDYIIELINNLQDCIEIFYEQLTDLYNWELDKGWFAPKLK